MVTDDDLPPVARFLRDARLTRLDQLSVNEAARRAAHISGGTFSRNTWDAAEKGDPAVLSKPPRIAVMALVLSDEGRLSNVTADDLQQFGEHEAAQIFRAHVPGSRPEQPARAGILRTLFKGKPTVDPLLIELSDEAAELPDEWQAMLRKSIAEIRSLRGVKPHEATRMEAFLLAQVLATYQSHITQMRIVQDSSLIGSQDENG
ncbi:hypothetical protein [Nonomuraea basaltis]|uniref:hypothetical protein n=1 Tax=Nonomuraea basaltis TaxID=2495887 RepID=UPI00110C55B5|nr:hypothetical protein [Nonomuraea basaltis]TMR91294.1 hypothetical protein EJK15_50785 [Nonomuraea basaltis]